MPFDPIISKKLLDALSGVAKALEHAFNSQDKDLSVCHTRIVREKRGFFWNNRVGVHSLKDGKLQITRYATNPCRVLISRLECPNRTVPKGVPRWRYRVHKVRINSPTFDSHSRLDVRGRSAREMAESAGGGRDATLCRDVEGNCHPRSGPWPSAADGGRGAVFRLVHGAGLRGP